MMAASTLSVCKFVGTVSLGLLTVRLRHAVIALATCYAGPRLLSVLRVALI